MQQQPKAGDIAVSTAGGRKLWWWRLAIRMLTGSHNTHAMVCTGEGTVVESIKGVGVVENLLPENCTILTANLTDAQRTAIVAWARRQIGKPYSWWQFVAAGLKFLRPLWNLFHRQGGYICSVLANAAYRAAGVVLTANLIVSPGELADAFTGVAAA